MLEPTKAEIDALLRKLEPPKPPVPLRGIWLPRELWERSKEITRKDDAEVDA